MHLFWYCPVAASFWQLVANWLSEQAILLSLSPLNIIWGYQDDKNMLLNIIVLLGKLYTFDSLKKLVLSSFILFLKHYYLQEKIIIKDRARSSDINRWDTLTISKTWDTEL